MADGVITKKEIAESISKSHDLSKVAANDVVNSVFELIAKELKKKQKISLAGFGTFQVGSRPARMGRNPKTGEPLKIKASKTVKFKVSSTVKTSL